MTYNYSVFGDVQFSSVAQSCPTLRNPMDHSTPGFLSITNTQNLLKLISTESMMPSNHLILCHPPLLLPSILPSIRVFSNKSALGIRWPKYWSSSFSISPSSEHSGLISFRMDWLLILPNFIYWICTIQIKILASYFVDTEKRILKCTESPQRLFLSWNAHGTRRVQNDHRGFPKKL